MSIKYSIAHIVGRFVFDRPTRDLTLSQQASLLEQSAKTVVERVQTVSDSSANREVFSHIIGIERWGMRRLRTALGESILMDEHDSYCPPSSRSLDELTTEFQATREKFIALVHELDRAGIDHTDAVRHNDLGVLSVPGWIRYLDMHATLEANRHMN